MSLHVPATADSSRSGRQAVDRLPLDADSEAAFALRLLVPELIGELRRSHPEPAPQDVISLSVRLHADYVRVEARRRGTARRSVTLHLPLAETHGRGLLLINALADSWGTAGGTADTAWLIWFELDLRR